jgi:pimeloyl-ACP methyl ester carboxylesterase
MNRILTMSLITQTRKGGLETRFTLVDDSEIAAPWVRFVAAVTALVFLTSCATQPIGRPQDVTAVQRLRAARSQQVSPETRAADYIEAAALTAPALGSGKQPTLALKTYNEATAELTVLLRSTEGGHLWNRPLTLSTDDATYHLRFAPSSRDVWAPEYFQSFEPAADVKETLIRKENHNEGVGGSLVGIHSTFPAEEFAPPRGITAPVTATLDFRGTEASLALRDPIKEPIAVVDAKRRPLAADFSAPLSYYRPPSNLLLVGILGALRSQKYMAKTGLYFLQPYNPDRIPLVFVHGLMSTPFTWVETINGLQADPEIRQRYQFWVFSYPTGNPILYSALRLREELAKVDKRYPNHRPYVLIGHSMGGILSQAQVSTLTPSMWNKTLNGASKDIFARNSSQSLIVRSMTFQANPRVNRVVFVCTPHRGSEMASSGLGRFGISLITLPLTIAKTIKDSITSAELIQITGSSKRLPNSVSGLAPTNPTFTVLNGAPMTTPYHSIIGDKGRGNSPNSTDGIVPYWSSHLNGAKSEVIVPGPHSSTALPETITELDRILKLHLKGS